MAFSIAIDGHAGSGKSTIAKILAKKLGAIYLDTGAMYRSVALKSIRSGLSTQCEEDMNRLMEHIDLRVDISDGQQRSILDGEQVDHLIRTPEISLGASDVGAFRSVRDRMVNIQRELSKQHSIVMEGRDIGTYVLPGATFKFFLTACPEERARRRFLQLKEEGKSADLEEIARDMELRDHNDSLRSIAPLKQAEDAIRIDTTNLSIQEVIEVMTRYIHGI